MICPEPVAGGLAIIGCNPATPDTTYYDIPPFTADSRETHLRSLPALEAKARQSYRYYTPFHGLAKDLGLPWEHIDLFFYRETKQKAVEALVTNRQGSLNEFGSRQITLAERLLILTRPRMILVANAFASKLFKAHFKLDQLDQDGLHWTTLGAQEVPTFLSSMLGGQRALDLGSLERLVWHMRKTLRAMEP